jgi:hypothetical protein
MAACVHHLKRPPPAFAGTFEDACLRNTLVLLSVFGHTDYYKAVNDDEHADVLPAFAWLETLKIGPKLKLINLYMAIWLQT